MDLVVFEIAEGGGVAVPPGEKVLVDAQHLRTSGARPLQGQLRQPSGEPALNGGAGDAFPLRQTGAVDAVVMPLADASPERLTGAQTGQNARKSLPEIAPASLALPFP